MIDLTDKAQLVKYLQSQGLYTKKKLGQNFLVDREALNKIIDAADIKANNVVVEIGSGLGVLTSELIQKAKKTIAVELDDKLAGLLKQQFCHPELVSGSKALDSGSQTAVRNDKEKGAAVRNDRKCELEIVNSDILQVNLRELLHDYKKYKVVANIPYYITSKIIKLFLTAEKKPDSIVMLVQKEVAERICAKPGDMSVLALSVQLYGDPEIIGIVKKESFFPAPEVDSAILKIGNIGFKKPEISEKELFRSIKIGFASRRKTLLNNFSAGLRLNKESVNDIISSSGIDAGKRAEELSLADWVSLTEAIRQIAQ